MENGEQVKNFLTSTFQQSPNTQRLQTLTNEAMASIQMTGYALGTDIRN